MRYVFLLFTLAFTANRSEGSDIYMSWKSTTEQLKINCIVRKLHYDISIFGPSGDLEAHCLPPVHNPRCNSFNADGQVEQIFITNTTTYTMYDKDISRLNGQWTCQHGSQKDKTSIEVKVCEAGQNVSKDQTCYEKFVTWTVIGFFPTFIILRILIWSVALIANVKGKVIKIVLPICTCIRPKKRISAIVCRRMAIILISSYFFMMPFIIGFLEKTTCKAPTLFSLAGSVCGLFINILWSEDEHNDGLQNRNRTNSIDANEEEEL